MIHGDCTFSNMMVDKDNNPIFDKLSDESKKLIEELKPRLEKINNNRKKKTVYSIC